MTLYRLRNFRRQLGFTLTEVAIVMGIVGLMLGSIWAAQAMVINSYRVNTMQQQLTTFSQNAINLFSRMPVQPVGSPGNGAYTYTDQNCPGGPMCSTALMITAGVFPPGFLSTVMTPNPPWGFGGSAYQTSLGNPIWTGVYDCGLYAGGGPPVPGECSGETVIELDLYNLSPQNCTRLLMAAVNSGMNNLMNIEAPSNGWGSVSGVVYFGNPTLKTTIDAATAAAACAAPGNSSYLWFIYSTD